MWFTDGGDSAKDGGVGKLVLETYLKCGTLMAVTPPKMEEQGSLH